MSYNSDNPITIENNLLRTYMVGSMENPAKLDGGIGWRQKLTPDLNARGIYAFDPTRMEMDKVQMPSEEFLDKLTGWQLSGNWHLFLENMRKIWTGCSYLMKDENGNVNQVTKIGDVGYVENSNFLICNYEEGDKLGGTIAEITIAWYRGIPVYLVTDAPKSKINKSVLFFILDSGNEQGRIFPNQSQLLEFLDKTYKLKVKK
jgi:hypothetical protein